MAKKPKSSEETPLDKEQSKGAIVKHDPRDIPEYLRKTKPEGLDLVKDYQSTPILQVVHPTSRKERQDEFGVGTVIANGEVVAEFNEPFSVVPLFFWPSWQKRRDKDDKIGNFVVEESFDKNSDLAKRSRSSELREEAYPNNPKMKFKYAECLNFAIEILSGPLTGSLAVVKFSIGGHAIGRKLCGYLERTGIAIYGNVIELECVQKSNTNNTWNQLEFNKAENPWVPEGDIARYQAIHNNLKQMYAANLLSMGREDVVDEKSSDEGKA